MYSARFGQFGIVSLALAIALTSGCHSKDSEHTTDNPEGPVRVELVSPVVAEGGVIRGERHKRLTLKWKVTNVSRSTLQGLKLGLDCQCRLESELPSELAPGESCEIALQFPSPEAGRASRKVPMTASTIDSPVAFLDFTISTPYSEGIWVHRPERLFVRGIEGEQVEEPFLLQRIEKRANPPHFSTAQLIPDDAGTVGWTVTSENVGEDGVYCRRDYRGVAHFPEFREYEQDVSINLIGNDGDPLTIPAHISVNPRLRIVPPKIRLSKGETRKVVAMAVENSPVRVNQYDETLVHVSKEEGSPEVPGRFMIECLSRAETPLTTSVSFVTENGDRQDLSVAIVAAND